MDNSPKVLLEFTPDEIKYIADHFCDVFRQITALKITLDPKSEIYLELEEKQKMAARFMNRAVDKAFEQGFGDI